MALFSDPEAIDVRSSPEFDVVTAPSALAPATGIFRCVGCGREDVSRRGEPLPPRDHHRHTSSQGMIRWRLVVLADHYPK